MGRGEERCFFALRHAGTILLSLVLRMSWNQAVAKTEQLLSSSQFEVHCWWLILCGFPLSRLYKSGVCVKLNRGTFIALIITNQQLHFWHQDKQITVIFHNLFLTANSLQLTTPAVHVYVLIENDCDKWGKYKSCMLIYHIATNRGLLLSDGFKGKTYSALATVNTQQYSHKNNGKTAE